MTLAGAKVIVVGLVSARDRDAPDELAALARRLEAQGCTVVGQVLQRRGVSRDKRPGGSKRMDRPLSATTVIGKGKAQELAELCRRTGAEVVVFHNALSDSQRRHLEELCATRVVDAAALDAGNT